MQTNIKNNVLCAQTSQTPSDSSIYSSGKQVVELSGYVIIIVEDVDGKVKLYGSPPDLDNLEVGDEILEVNGLQVENISRTDIIRHIHDCIRSCTICLRVKKKVDSKLAKDIGNSIQDAFLIAVEEHARERLKRLAALNRVNPVDITQLSKKLQQNENTNLQKQDLSFLKENCPIYVTSFANTRLVNSKSTISVPLCKAKTTLSYAKDAAEVKSDLPINTLINKETSISYQKHKIPVTEELIVENKSVPNVQDKPYKTETTDNHVKTTIWDDDDIDYSEIASRFCSINYIDYNKKEPQTVAEVRFVGKIPAYSTQIYTPFTITNQRSFKEKNGTLHPALKSKNSEPVHTQYIAAADYAVPTLRQLSTDARDVSQSVAAVNSISDAKYSTIVTQSAKQDTYKTEAYKNTSDVLTEKNAANATPTIRFNQTLTNKGECFANAAAPNEILQNELKQSSNNFSDYSMLKGRTELLLGDQTVRQDLRSRRRSSIVALNSEDTKPCFLNNSNTQQTTTTIISEPKDKKMLTMISMNDENGPHREMAVDCPESFIARNKTPPRYPPPRLPQFSQTAKRDLINIENDNMFADNSAETPKINEQRKTEEMSTQNRGGQNHQSQHIAQIVEPTSVQLNSIKKYQEQLRRRREEEERIAQQNEFLRASLRGSQKLKALQDCANVLAVQEEPIVTQYEGFENNAFINDEVKSFLGYNDMLSSLTLLINQLTKYGKSTLAASVTSAYNLLSNTAVARALATRTAIQEQRYHLRKGNTQVIEALRLQKDVLESLAQSNTAAAIELCNILSSHEMEGLLMAHDHIGPIADAILMYTANGAIPERPLNTVNQVAVQTSPELSALTMPPARALKMDANKLSQSILEQKAAMLSPFGTINDQPDNIRIIQIEKSTEPLGATVRNEGEAVVIGRIVRGGAAEKSGLLHEGDEILEVNGQELRGKTVNEVCALLSGMTGTLTFLIVQNNNSKSSGNTNRENAVLHVRSHFDYDPEDDLYIPCRELGISFQKGDVLHIISREDPNWWQAYREGEEDQTLAGLIPSQSFQHQREAMKISIAEEAGLNRIKDKDSKASTLLCARKGRKKKKKASSEAGYPLYATTAPDEAEPEEILTYEEVALYYPRATHKRPIVLIGPPNIGRHELRQRLMADSDRFSAAVPHTSRARREGEVPGVDYHFITRQAFEEDILARRFVEHGEYEKAYYGTSLEAIRTVVASGKICVLNLHPQSLKLLRSSDLKPYVVLVAPPSLEKLRQKKIRNGEPFKEDELKDIIATARDMEARWGHLFDMIIINNDTERAYHQLLTEINSLEREPQWVPASWVHNNEC